MPLFTIIGRDGPDGLELRKLHRDAHLANLEPLEQEGRIRYAGPLLDTSGNPCGSVIVLEQPSLAAALGVAARDPYGTQGIFASHEVIETRQVFPKG